MSLIYFLRELFLDITIDYYREVFRMISLDKIELNKIVTIKNLNGDNEIKRRLMDIGIVPNNKIEKIFSSAFGGISAYNILDCSIAIRDVDAKLIEVEYD